jgi:hypothetical protein
MLDRFDLRTKQRKIVEEDLAAFDRLLAEKKIPLILSDFKEKKRS